MFFNFFLFSLIGYNAISSVVVVLVNDGLRLFSIENIVAVNINELPIEWRLLLLFLVRDFIHFNVHRLLHRVPWLWRFHKVHHSVKEMGFAAHLRFHFMENVIYRTLEYIPLAMIGYGLGDFFLVHLFTLTIGHFNHSNIYVPLGPLRYVFNNPQMHLWHHARSLPKATGVNFGLTLSIWDYVFKTAYEPDKKPDTPLGFEGIENYPEGFWKQTLAPFKKKP